MLRKEAVGPVLRLTLHRPEVRNAFNEELIQALREAFGSVPGSTRVVILEGEGKAFCAGGDIEWMRRAGQMTPEENERDALALAQLFRAIQECRALVIARAHGAVLGGGCGLVAAADLALCDPDCQFSFSEVKLGLIPGTISSVVIPKIGPGHARSLFATGLRFDAEHALRIGLVHRIATDLAAAEAEVVAEVLKAGPSAVAESKRLVLEAPLSLEETARRLAQTRSGAEAKEGLDAFLNKRPAAWVQEEP